MNSYKQESQNQGEARQNGSPCWGPSQWAGCGCFSSQEWPDAMARCFSFCRYFMLVPVILGTVFLLIGYTLSPETIRIFWMIGATVLAGLGLLAVLVMQRFARGNGFSGCCGAWTADKTSRPQQKEVS